MPTVDRAKNSFVKDLKKLDACPRSIAWVRRQEFSSHKAAWDSCNNGEHLFWALIKLGTVPIDYLVRCFDAIRVIVPPSMTDFSRAYLAFPDYVDSICSDMHYAIKDYSDNPRGDLRKCARAIRSIVPWNVVRDAVKKWRKA
jgi:hypothetical protein